MIVLLCLICIQTMAYITHLSLVCLRFLVVMIFVFKSVYFPVKYLYSDVIVLWRRIAHSQKKTYDVGVRSEQPKHYIHIFHGCVPKAFEGRHDRIADKYDPNMVKYSTTVLAFQTICLLLLKLTFVHSIHWNWDKPINVSLSWLESNWWLLFWIPIIIYVSVAIYWFVTKNSAHKLSLRSAL